MTRKPSAASLAFAGLPWLTMLGCAGLVANVALSFEEPHRGLLWISAALLAAAPVGMALHLALAGELTAEDRRRWLAGLAGRRAPELFAAYFTPAARRRATERLASAENE